MLGGIELSYLIADPAGVSLEMSPFQASSCLGSVPIDLGPTSDILFINS